MSRLHRPFAVAVATTLLFGYAPDAVALAGGEDPPSPTPPLSPTATPAPTPTPGTTPGPVQVAAAADPGRLPDLGLGRVGDLRLIRTTSGRLQLRLSSTLINVGAGPLVVRADRENGRFTVAQRVPTLDGRRPFRTLPVGTKYAGDAHSHWHIKDVVQYTLTSLDEDRSRRANKIGFCIYDNVRRAPRPGRPAHPEYLREGCGRQNSNRLRMGLSVGWGDLYTWTLRGQYVNMTGLPAGDYRLLGTANPDGVFYEQREDNNFVYVDFRFGRENGKATIRIMDRGVRPEDQVEVTAVDADATDHTGHAAGDDGPSASPAAVAPGAATVTPRSHARRSRGRA